MRKSFMKTFVDAQKDYDQLEIYRKWLRDNNVSFQEDEDGEALYFCYQGGNFMIKVPKSDRNWLGLFSRMCMMWLKKKESTYLKY